MTGTSYHDRWIEVEDGLKLHVRSYGPEDADQTVVCLPGLTRNGRDFHPLALRLAAKHQTRVVTIDSRGRGLSDWDDDKSRYVLPVEAKDVLDLCATLGIERAAFIGTSRGGLILHLIVAVKPALLAGVILNDIGPAIEMTGLRHIQDYLSRERLPPADFAAAAAAQKADHAPAFPALGETDWLDLAHALYRRVGDSIRADYDPAIAEQIATANLDKAAPDLWPQFELFSGVPMMVIRGGNSTLLTDKTVAEMQERHPGLKALTVPGQGHPPLLHIEPTASRIEAFLERIGKT